jgi:hypothetical protein
MLRSTGVTVDCRTSQASGCADPAKDDQDAASEASARDGLRRAREMTHLYGDDEGLRLVGYR